MALDNFAVRVLANETTVKEEDKGTTEKRSIHLQIGKQGDKSEIGIRNRNF
jgi:hypothetical protein